MARDNAKVEAELPSKLFDTEGERLILANVLTRGKPFWNVVAPQLAVQHFSLESYRRLFSLMLKIADAGGDPDLAGCYRALIDDRKASAESGLPQLSDLAWNNTVELTNPAGWIASLKRKAAERDAWRLAEKTRLGFEAGTISGEDVAAIRDQFRRIETELEPAAPTVGTIGETIADIGIDNLLAQPRGVIASPWPRLTELVNGGPRPGELWIIAARPSIGKTTVAMQWGLSAARAGQHVQMFSLEMPARDLMKRVLSSEGDIPHGLLVRGDLESAYRLRVAQTLERIADFKLEVTDKLRTLSGITSKIATGNAAMAVIDYLGLIETQARFETRNQDLGAWQE